MTIVVPNYQLLENSGLLLSDKMYLTPITGHGVIYHNDLIHCMLSPSGLLTVYAGSVWDFGTFAIDTPAMVYASLPHDAFCAMTHAGVLPWEIRGKADKYFWDCLTRAGAKYSRLWRVPLVMLNSQTIARIKAKPYRYNLEV